MAQEARLAVDLAASALQNARRLLQDAEEIWAIRHLDEALTHVQRAMDDLSPAHPVAERVKP